MIIVMWILSVLLIAEFVMAPINLWTGRAMPWFRRFTSFSRRRHDACSHPSRWSAPCSSALSRLRPG
jgi:hypothetical protein